LCRCRAVLRCCVGLLRDEALPHPPDPSSSESVLRPGLVRQQLC